MAVEKTAFNFLVAANTAPAVDAEAVSPADTNLPAGTCRALYVGGAAAGDLTIMTSKGNIVTFADVQPGSIIPIQALQVRAATTSTDIVALY